MLAAAQFGGCTEADSKLRPSVYLSQRLMSQRTGALSSLKNEDHSQGQSPVREHPVNTTLFAFSGPQSNEYKLQSVPKHKYQTLKSSKKSHEGPAVHQIAAGQHIPSKGMFRPHPRIQREQPYSRKPQTAENKFRVRSLAAHQLTGS